MNGVSQDELHAWIEIDRIDFVTGRKIKYFSVTAFPSATGTKYVAAFEPGNKNHFVRSRDGEWFSVHLRVLDFEITIKPMGDRMRRVANPDTLLFAGFAPR